jgi:hypothetical protein
MCKAILLPDAATRAPVGHGLRVGHAPSSGTSPIRCGDNEAVESDGLAASHGGDEVRWTATALRGLLRHRRGKGWVSQCPDREEKAVQVELTKENNGGGGFGIPAVGAALVVAGGVDEVLQCHGAEMEVGLG